MTDQYDLEGNIICLHDGGFDFCPSLVMGGCSICKKCKKHIMSSFKDEENNGLYNVSGNHLI